LGASVIAINTDGIYLNKQCNLSTKELLPICYKDTTLISEKIGHFKPPKEVNKMPINYTQRTSIAVEEQVIKKNQWKQAELKPNSSILITGMPGSGKSYTWKQFKKQLLVDLKKNQIKEMSFQNNVAADISEDAATLHKIFLLDVATGKTSQSLFKRFKKVRYIYVDEAQMMPSKCVKILIWI
jgi:predicted AAA+ superfamily ATPase